MDSSNNQNKTYEYQEPKIVFAILLACVPLFAAVAYVMGVRDLTVLNIFVIVLNTIFILLDLGEIRYYSGLWKIWAFICVPVYLFMRARKVDNKYVFGFIWIADTVIYMLIIALISLTPIINNTPYETSEKNQIVASDNQTSTITKITVPSYICGSSNDLQENIKEYHCESIDIDANGNHIYSFTQDGLKLLDEQYKTKFNNWYNDNIADGEKANVIKSFEYSAGYTTLYVGVDSEKYVTDDASYWITLPFDMLSYNMLVKGANTEKLEITIIIKDYDTDEVIDTGSVCLRDFENMIEKDTNTEVTEEYIKEIQQATDLSEATEENATDIPLEYRNALESAKSYSDNLHMSKKGIYEQLISEYGEQFPEDAAQYAIDNVVADWNENALKSAISYSDSLNMSKQAIYEQLISEYGEQFEPEEAQYAIDNLE